MHNTDSIHISRCISVWAGLFCVCLFHALGPVATEAADEALEYRSHPPQRPLPVAIPARPITEPALFVDAAQGDDRADGSRLHPWRTIQHAVRQLRAGDTLYLRGGVYHETVSLTRSGTAEAPIIISAYPGELPVLDGAQPEFLASPKTCWQPATDGASDEYISTSTYQHLDDRRVPHHFLPGAWEPMWGLEHQRPLALGHFADSMVPLHGYRTLDDLRSANELNPQRKDEGAVYCGPGLWFNRDTGRVHIRLAHTRLEGLGERAYRGVTDPRELRLIVAVGLNHDVLRISGIEHVKIKGLVLRGATGSPLLHIYGSRHIDLDHLTVYGGFPALLINASQNLRVTHSAFRGLAAPWSGRAHMKYRGTASYQVILQNGQPYNEHIELAYCEFTDDHDFAFLRYVKHLDFHHNYVDNFNDDGLECGPKLRWHSMAIHHNRIGACLGTLQQHELDKDESPATHDVDSGVNVYRNVFDGRAGVYYHLPSAPDPSGSFLRHEGALLSDHGSPTFPVFRIYHNTFLRRTPAWRNYFLFGLGARGMRDTERDVFNNLFLQETGVPGAVVPGKEAFTLREGGNLLWATDNDLQTAAAGIERFRKSPLFEASREVYARGWTADDLITPPLLTEELTSQNPAPDLRPTRDSPAIDSGIPLPTDWPDPWRAQDRGTPDIGVLPWGAAAWGVGIEGRIPLFGESSRSPRPGAASSTDVPRQ